jgi:hypothetical protein
VRRVPVEVVQRAWIVGEAACLRASRVRLDGPSVHNHEERLKAACDDAAYGRVRPNVPEAD